VLLSSVSFHGLCFVKEYGVVCWYVDGIDLVLRDVPLAHINIILYIVLTSLRLLWLVWRVVGLE
jgi:hypothetical protein